MGGRVEASSSSWSRRYGINPSQLFARRHAAVAEGLVADNRADIAVVKHTW